jgi:hypothetical protein
MSRQRLDKGVSRCRRQMFGHFDRHDEIETAIEMNRFDQVHLAKPVRRYAQQGPIDVRAVQTDEIVQPVVGEHAEPSADSTADIQHRTRSEEIEQDRDHYSRRADRAVLICLKEPGAVGGRMRHDTSYRRGEAGPLGTTAPL